MAWMDCCKWIYIAAVSTTLSVPPFPYIYYLCIVYLLYALFCPPKISVCPWAIYIMSYIMSLYKSRYLLSHSVLLQECFRYSWPFVIFIKMLVLSSSTNTSFWSFDCENIKSADECGEMWPVDDSASLIHVQAHISIWIASNTFQWSFRIFSTEILCIFYQIYSYAVVTLWKTKTTER